MTRAEYEKLKDFPKDKLIDIIKEEDRLIKVISECWTARITARAYLWTGR